jgi:hypothetical protein
MLVSRRETLRNIEKNRRVVVAAVRGKGEAWRFPNKAVLEPARTHDPYAIQLRGLLRTDRPN